MSYSQYINLTTSDTIISVDRSVNFLKRNTNITRLILRCSKINYEVKKELAQLSHLTLLDLIPISAIQATNRQ